MRVVLRIVLILNNLNIINMTYTHPTFVLRNRLLRRTKPLLSNLTAYKDNGKEKNEHQPSRTDGKDAFDDGVGKAS